MSDKYKIVEVHLETMPFKLMIYQVPESELNDKLTYFTRERGLIARDLYNDFLIANCVSNITDFLQYVRQVGTTVEKLNEIREELIEKVMSINPKLMPSNLVLNTNHVVKIKDGKLQEGEIALTDNEYWKKDVYKLKASEKTDEQKQLDMTKVQHIKDLNYTKVQKFWRRLGHYVTVRQFEPGAEVVIVGDRRFTTRTAFEQYIISVCVEEVEDLFIQLERLQIAQRVSPHIIIHELYELCRKSNPLLDFDIYKDNVGEQVEDSSEVDPFESVQQAAQGKPEDFMSEVLKKKAKTFRDVEKKKLLSLAEDMKKKVVGQDKPVEDLVDAIQRASVGLKDPEHPIGSFIFTGHTGIGKTYTAKVLAEELVGNRNTLVTVDCSEYSADHEYAKLIGAPSGYIGHEQGGYLTNAIKKNPFSIILFDEVEKASEKVHQLLLQIMDEGRLTDGKGQKVSFRDAILIMTSNLGVNESQAVEKTIGFGDAAVLTKEKRLQAVKNALKKKFKPEFLNRITAMIDFDALQKDDYMNIIKLELEKLKKYFKLNRTPYSKLTIKFDKSIYNHIYTVGIDTKFGARPLQRAIEREISTPLARKILQDNFDCSNTRVTISAKRGKVIMTVICIKNKKSDVDDPPFYMSANGGEDELKA